MTHRHVNYNSHPQSPLSVVLTNCRTTLGNSTQYFRFSLNFRFRIAPCLVPIQELSSVECPNHCDQKQCCHANQRASSNFIYVHENFQFQSVTSED